MEIVVDKQNQFQIPSSEIGRTILRSEFMELKKKRKLQAEQFGMPLPKHKCEDRNFNSDSCLHHHPTTNNGAKKYIASDSDDDDSGLESVKDSNSFVDESNPSIISTSAESKMDSRPAKTWSSDWPCTPSNDLNRTYNNSMDGGSSSSYSIIIDPQNSYPKWLRPYQDDDLQEFGSQMEDGFLEQGMECDEQASDEHFYVLSLGRWTVDQGKAVAQKREDKLTIDKEFEQYFSMLML